MLVALSTWKHGFHPNRVAYEALAGGLSALDAVELGAKYCEADLSCMSVGRGGIPDDEGMLSLDASIMDHDGNCGAVAFVQHYPHPISIARCVMEKTNHIMLAGTGAEAFAETEGFLKSDLMSERSKALYDKWKRQPNRLNVRLRRSAEGEHEYVFEEITASGERREVDRDNPDRRPVNESHDTIGIIGRDRNGRLAGACTTSGLAFKKHGRVGDSPIIGAGLYVDGEHGAAVATGNGEFVMRACSTFHLVELMRQGVEMERALELAIARLKLDKQLTDEVQVGLLVIRPNGEWGARSLRPGFQFAAAEERSNGANVLFDCTSTGFTEAPATPTR